MKRWTLSRRGDVSGWPRTNCSAPPMTAIAATMKRQTWTTRNDTGIDALPRRCAAPAAGVNGTAASLADVSRAGQREVGPRPRLEFGAQPRRAVDRVAGEERGEDGASPGAELGVRDVRVFAPDLRVLGEAC